MKFMATSKDNSNSINNSKNNNNGSMRTNNLKLPQITESKKSMNGKLETVDWKMKLEGVRK